MSSRLLTDFQWLRIVAATILLVGFSACDAHTGARGVVVDADGKPIAGAEVRLVRLKTGRTDVRLTDENGAFSCGIIHGAFAGEFQLSVSKSGFVTYHRKIDAKANISEKIVLVRESEKAR